MLHQSSSAHQVLEAKDRAGGFRWRLRKSDNIETGVTERRDKKGQHIGYVEKCIVTIKGFDGKKRTLRTNFFDLDRVPTRQTAFGVYDDQLAGRYHGENSKNWKPTQLTLNELINLLNRGYAVAPGRFDRSPAKSHRSSKYQAYQRLILFDGDEWSETCPAPMSLVLCHTKVDSIKIASTTRSYRGGLGSLCRLNRHFKVDRTLDELIARFPRPSGCNRRRYASCR